MAPVDIGGWVEARFEPVLDAFAENFDRRGEVGAAVCAYLDGHPVVDLWGGLADATTGQPWSSDSVVVVFSSTKGVTSVCANLLIERGRLDPAAPVAQYWPEFAAGHKAAITVAQTISHQAGLPMVDGEYTLTEVLSWDPMVRALAAQEPIWPPGTHHGYHMRTFGWLVGELVRRVDGSGSTFGSDCRNVSNRASPDSCRLSAISERCYDNSMPTCCWRGCSPILRACSGTTRCGTTP